MRLEEERFEIEKHRVLQDAYNNSHVYNLQVERMAIKKCRLDLHDHRFQKEKEERSAQLDQFKQLAVSWGKLTENIN